MPSWVKHGLVIEPRGQAPWVGSHAALPVVLDAPDGQRVYFSSRDAKNRAHIGFATLRLAQPLEPAAWADAPVLSPGALGAFDDSGVTSSCLVAHDGRLFLYYTGWTLGVTVPFYLHAGVAVSDDGGVTFARVSAAPLLERIDVDPYLSASPWVLRDNGMWRMWYVSGTGWEARADGPRHRYHIKYAESRDGLRWTRHGVVCLDYASPEEYAFGRPCVVRDADRYRMWYSFRGSRYRMGYAESSDGLTWTRHDDQHVVAPSTQGWDAEMVTYPVVAGPAGHRAMLYNGNDFGRTGIGLATESA
ncbi:MAG TPA: hypothetical protein VMW48_15425 [Vicinamibacterales bacterium]|nr:hypothetical protein [Vicinamibacterales bacterium]